MTVPTAGSSRTPRVIRPAASLRHFPLFLLVLSVAACETAAHAPATGRFAYSASHTAPGGGTGITELNGAVVFESASDDLVEGHWDVDQLSPEFGLGTWDLDAYVVYAYPTYGGTLVHRIRRVGEPDQLACEGHYTLVLAGGSEQRVPLSCSIEPVPPVGVPPEIPQPTTETITPADSESVILPASADTLGDVP